MPKAIRRILLLILSAATALVALLTFLLGIGKADWGERCQVTDDCKPNLVCAAPSTPYCTQACDPKGRDTCVKGFSCADDGVCHKD